MNSIQISRVAEDGERQAKEIYELPEEDDRKYRMLGKAIGITMAHCVQLGSKHARDFWNRVYGYMIIKDDKTEKMMLEAMRKVKPEVESYMTVSFYERRVEDRFQMFVPQRLEIPDRPELSNFPLNIVFGSEFIVDNNVHRFETAVYDPDLSTFEEEGSKQKMKYYNNLNQERFYWVEVVYDVIEHSYEGSKYFGDKKVGMAFGKNWNMFFVHFTALGV